MSLMLNQVFRTMDARHLLGRLTIIHPYSLTIIHLYSTVGGLEWEDGPADTISFGGADGANVLSSIASNLKTFRESTREETTVNAMRALHRENMDLIKPQNHSKVARVFATAIGISEKGREVIKTQIQHFSGADHIELRCDLACAGLLNDYRHTLAVSAV